MYDVIVVGAGFSGAVFARQMAEAGKKVVLLEKRPHIGGNMFECFRDNAIRVHRYGPHIFHTNNNAVYTYLEKFSAWIVYTHKVLGKIQGEEVPIPINFHSIDLLFDYSKAEGIKKSLLSQFKENSRVPFYDLLQSSDTSIRDFGEFVYQNVYMNYTSKQWGIPIENIDKSTLSRVPVIIGYADGYFNDAIQMMPKFGFTALFESILDHPAISLQLNTDATSRLFLDFNSGKIMFDTTIFEGIMLYSGSVDALLQYKFGVLPYRSLDFIFEDHACDYYQKCAVVNYPNEELYTRITEFKYLTGQKSLNATSILKEYAMPYVLDENEPYYPIINEKNSHMYQLYCNALAGFKNLILCGRLAEYRYYNMDAVIERALSFAEAYGA